jgi:hypothetical protein
MVMLVDHCGVKSNFTRFCAKHESAVLGPNRCLALISQLGWRIAVRAMFLWRIALA